MSVKSVIKKKEITDKTENAITEETDLLVLHNASCSKLSARSQGKLDYQIGYSYLADQLYLRVLTNNSGGYFSKEWVPIAVINSSLDEVILSGGAFTAPKLIPAFISKSQNNAGFLAAVLLAEGIIEKVVDRQHLLTLTKGGLKVWQAKWIKTAKGLSNQSGEKKESSPHRKQAG